MDHKPDFSKLFEPISIGSMTVKNRVVIPPMGTGFPTPDGLINQRTLDYYEARARGGAGMVIVETACVDFPRGIQAARRIVIDNDATLPGLTALASVIKKNGARAVLQLNHAGRMGNSRRNGIQPVAPSAIPAPPAETPRDLSVDEIARIVTLFAQGAERAKKAGFDGIEVHAAHGYLLATFCSPYWNKRQDRYGGGPENRARMLIEVLSAIKNAIGNEFPLWCRINGREYGVQDGLSLEDSQDIARRLNGLVDAFSVSAFGYGPSALVVMPDTPGALLPLAAEIKKVVSVPIIAVGRLNAEVGEKAVAGGRADLIALGRQSIADPEAPNKIASGRLEDIRPCIACFYCSDISAPHDSHILCQVNAELGQERECEIRTATIARKIAVIGGGPAGLEASRVLALRGHKVVLFEREDHLGGLVAVGSIPPHKERLRPLIGYFATQLEKLNVDIRLSTEATADLIAGLGAEAIVIATGSTSLIPKIPGVEGKNVCTAIDTLTGKAQTGNTVVVIGGGSTGCETAEFLLQRGKNTIVVEMLPGLAQDASTRERARLLSRISSLPITFLTSTRCTEIQADGIRVRGNDRAERFIAADTVVLAAGVRPYNTLFQQLHARGIETHMAGDCWHPGMIAQAVRDGSRIGRTL